MSILSKTSSWGLEWLCDRCVRELCMCACHTNHSVGCIKERIKLPVGKLDDIYSNLETCQITVVVQSNILWLTI